MNEKKENIDKLEYDFREENSKETLKKLLLQGIVAYIKVN